MPSQLHVGKYLQLSVTVASGANGPPICRLLVPSKRKWVWENFETIVEMMDVPHPGGRCVTQGPFQPAAGAFTSAAATHGKSWANLPLKGIAVISLPFFTFFSLCVLNFQDPASKLPPNLPHICTHKGVHTHIYTHAQSCSFSLK